MEGGVEEVSIEELASNLSTYKEQLDQVRQLLSEDPRNAEYADMEKELKEVIALTETLLTTAKQNEISLSDAGVSAREAAGSPDLEGAWEKMESRNDPIHEGKFPVGTKVQAVFSDDGEWYDATIEAHTVNGYFVAYDEWGNKEEVDPDNVRPIEQNALLEAERLAEATKNALKRKIEQAASSDFQTKTVPAKLKIDPNDPEDVQSVRRYMHSSQRRGKSNSRLYRTRNKMLGNSFRQRKPKLKR
ncbi:hypothetical protein CARUB_v10017839mg [Capsella rubella]|uniref:Tudor domain-containing protein n=1 Tax=Capsella rubella TaxID=81985 RepID=R0FQY5_9BRAS|nr:hypothetical protein CARUB_v10017839mg [Capsella rubella]